MAGGGFRGPWPASHLTEYPRLSVTDDCTPNTRGDHGLATAHGCLHQGMTAALVTGPHTTPATGRTRAERSSDE